MSTHVTARLHSCVTRPLFLAISTLCLAAMPIPVHAAGTFPEIIPLPNGFHPEGIAIGRGTDMYVGSLNAGAIYKADLRTGKGAILVPDQPGRFAVGMGVDRRTNLLFVAGGRSGHAYVYDVDTGVTVADYQLTTASNTLINDVTITDDAAYFTDTFRPAFYRVDLGAGGRLPATRSFQEIPISGDMPFLPAGFNSNGIVSTSNGKWLIIVHTDLGRVYRVDPRSGVSTQINLGVDRVGQDGSDGLVLAGKTLYIVDFYNQLIPIELSRDFTSGEIGEPIVSPLYENPSTAARFGSAFYVVNAKLDVPVTPDLPYRVTRVER